MLWHTEMACGVHLGILLIYLLQAEHVCCLWASQVQSSQGQNGNRYVGFLQQHSGLESLGGSYPQNQLRQASAQSSSFNTETAVSSGYNQGLSSGGKAQTLSQPAHSGYASVRLVQSSSVSKPNWRVVKPNQVKAQEVPKKPSFSLSTSIASGSSVSKHSQNQNDLTEISNKRTWPIQQGTQRTSKYLSGSSASLQSPLSKSRPASHQSAAQKASSTAAKTPAYYGQKGYSPMTSSSLFSAGAPVPKRNSAQMQTSATAPARRVSTRHSSNASKPPRFSSPQHGGTRNNPSHMETRQPYQSKLFQATGGNAQGSYKPTYTSSMASSPVSYSQSLPGSNKQNARVNFRPRGPEMPSSQRLSYKPSFSSTEQISSSTSSLQAPWKGRNPSQARNLPSSGSSRAGTPARHFAPTKTYNIPPRFGGFAIRRLKDPDDQKEVSAIKPQQTYTAPSQQSASYKPQVQSVQQESKWRRVRPSGTQAGAAGVHG